MSDRDELAEILERSDPEGGSHPDYGGPEFSYWYPQADAVIAAGWRKKPSRDDLARVLAVSNGWPLGEWEQIITEPISRTLTYWATADAILALLDGPTETGAVTEGDTE